MKYISKYITLIGLLSISTALLAKDKLLTFDFNQVVQQGYDQGILDKKITFKLAGQNHKTIKKNFSEYRSNKKTNGVGKAKTESCSWALLGALKSMQGTAISIGANAVVNIKSNFKNREYISSTEYQCGAGFLMSGVAIKANIVTI